MAEDEDDFGDSWSLLDREVPSSKNLVNRHFEEIAREAQRDLLSYLESIGQVTVNSEVLSDIVAKGVQLFIEKWDARVRSYNLVGLLEVILEGQDLNPVEVKGFIRALPDRLIRKVIHDSIGPAQGIQAFMAVEHLYRVKRLKADYSIHKNSRGRIFLRVPHGEEVIDIYLDDTFDGLPPEPGAPS